MPTGAEHKLPIAEIAFGLRGRIGITLAPGRIETDSSGSRRLRDLAADLDRIRGWQAASVVTLVAPQELDVLGIPQLGEEVMRRGMQWHHWPIRDYGVPDAPFEAAWPSRSSHLRALLAQGGRVLVHCKGGLGRSGMVVARLLAESGMPVQAAIAAVLAARPGAIETAAQELWVDPAARPPLRESSARHRR